MSWSFAPSTDCAAWLFISDVCVVGIDSIDSTGRVKRKRRDPAVGQQKAI